MNDQTGGIDARIAEATRDLYHAPPPAPSEEMWADIQARLVSEPPVVPIQSASGRSARSRMGWWVGIAAALAIGLGLGRLSLVPTPAGDSAAEIADRSGSDAERSTWPYMLATRSHLDRAESFLTTVKTDRRSGWNNPEIGTWARSLLSRTRLLMATPAAAEGPELKALLEDLELMLMQIVVTADTDDPQESLIVDQGLEESDLLLRLRSAASKNNGPASGPTFSTL